MFHVTGNKEPKMGSTTVERVKKHRAALRQAGLRPVQIWVPDVRRAGFAQECRRQSLAVAEIDRNDTELTTFMDEALSDIDGWQA